MAPGLKVNRHRVGQARVQMPARNGRQVSQAVLAELIGVHWVTVSNIERGKTDPSYHTLQKIAKATGKPLDWFLEVEDDEREPEPDDELEAEVSARELFDVLLGLARDKRVARVLA